MSSASLPLRRAGSNSGLQGNSSSNEGGGGVGSMSSSSGIGGSSSSGKVTSLSASGNAGPPPQKYGSMGGVSVPSASIPSTSASSSSSSSSFGSAFPPRPSVYFPPHRTQLPPRYSYSNSGGLNNKSRKLRASTACIFSCLLSLLTLLFLMSVFGPSARLLPLLRRPSPSSASDDGILPIGATSAALSHSLLSSSSSSSHFSARTRYGVIIDAGSSGSRVHVYAYHLGPAGVEGPEGLPVVLPGGSRTKKIRPGLSSFAERPEEAGASLQPLIDFAMKHVPRRQWSHTRVQLMATAGMRQVDAAAAAAVLSSCRRRLLASPFLFAQDTGATIISGTWEGLYAWVAANYAHGLIGQHPRDTVGVVELGGASAQLSFVPDVAPPAEYRHSLLLGGVEYVLYAHSFLNFGQESAHLSVGSLLHRASQQEQSSSLSSSSSPHLHSDPCHHSGFTFSQHQQREGEGEDIVPLGGEGNFTACKHVALRFIQEGATGGASSCPFPHCLRGSVFIPELRGFFIATENFFYTLQFFGLPPTATLAELAAVGDEFCQQPWGSIRARHEGHSEGDLAKYCFSAAYIVALLHHGLGASLHDTRFRFTNKVGHYDVEWSLGALLMDILSNSETNTQSTSQSRSWMTFTSMAFLVVILSIILSVSWLLSRQLKAPLKTIYDLEKGRYITSSSSRRLSR